MSATATLSRSAVDHPAYPSSAETITEFSVDVVDGNGLPVAYQPVTVRYRYRSAPAFQTVVTADADGRARFADHHAETPLDLTLVSGGELNGPHEPRALYTVEM